MGWDRDDCIKYFWITTFKSDDPRFEDKCWKDLTYEDMEIVEKEFDIHEDQARSYDDLFTTPR